MKNRYLVIAGILLLAGALLFGSIAAQRTAAAANCSCGTCTCSKVVAKTQPAESGKCCGMGMKDMCSCMSSGPGKKAYDAFMKRTAGTRKSLAENREKLNTLLQKKPVNKAQAMRLITKINALQSNLYREAASTWIDMCGKQCEKGCKCSENAIVSIMMMSDQCPMKYCMKAMGCDMKGMNMKCEQNCGCSKGGECTCPKHKNK